ncbi:MAG: 3-hydroxyacyl-ACP dehydratase, partial [Ginsengibacter sp.]
MLLNDFFTISNLESHGQDIKVTLVINADHRIFEGHFPGQPVVPGVCMMQMVKEILEQVLEKSTNLFSASEMKFLAVINPIENNVVEAFIKYTPRDVETVDVSASIQKGS